MNITTAHPALLARIQNADKASFPALELFIQRIFGHEDETGAKSVSGVELEVADRWLVDGVGMFLAGGADPIESLSAWIDARSLWLEHTPDAILVELNAGRDRLLDLLARTPSDSGPVVASYLAPEPSETETGPATHSETDARALARVVDVVIAMTLASSMSRREANMVDQMIGQIVFPADPMSDGFASTGSVVSDAQGILDAASAAVTWSFGVDDPNTTSTSSIGQEDETSNEPSADEPQWDEESLIVNTAVMIDWLSSEDEVFEPATFRGPREADFRLWQAAMREQGAELIAPLARQWTSLLETVDPILASLYSERLGDLSKQLIGVFQSEQSMSETTTVVAKLMQASLLPFDVAVAGIRLRLARPAGVSKAAGAAACAWADGLELDICDPEKSSLVDDETVRIKHLTYILERTGLSISLYKTLRNQRNKG